MNRSAYLIGLGVGLVLRTDREVDRRAREIEGVVTGEGIDGVAHLEESGAWRSSEHKTGNDALEARAVEHGVFVPDESGVVAFLDGEDSFRQTGHGVVFDESESGESGYRFVHLSTVTFLTSGQNNQRNCQRYI